MDGGGFNTSQSQQSERNKGVLPINSHILLRSAGSNSNARFDHGGVTHRLGAVQRLVGTLEDYEKKETHWVLKINDYCLDAGASVHVIVTAGQVPGFTDTICETYRHHFVEIVGLLDDHLDFGRTIKCLSLREVQSPFQWIGHLMEVALFFKKLNSAESGNKENADPSRGKAQISTGGAMNDQQINQVVDQLISRLGADNTWGCKRDEIYSEVDTGKIPKPKVDAAIQFLIDEGTIYNTLDDDTFKSSDQ